MCRNQSLHIHILLFVFSVITPVLGTFVAQPHRLLLLLLWHFPAQGSAAVSQGITYMSCSPLRTKAPIILRCQTLTASAGVNHTTYRSLHHLKQIERKTLSNLIHSCQIYDIRTSETNICCTENRSCSKNECWLEMYSKIDTLKPVKKAQWQSTTTVVRGGVSLQCTECRSRWQTSTSFKFYFCHHEQASSAGMGDIRWVNSWKKVMAWINFVLERHKESHLFMNGGWVDVWMSPFASALHQQRSSWDGFLFGEDGGVGTRGGFDLRPYYGLQPPGVLHMFLWGGQHLYVRHRCSAADAAAGWDTPGTASSCFHISCEPPLQSWSLAAGIISISIIILPKTNHCPPDHLVFLIILIPQTFVHLYLLCFLYFLALFIHYLCVYIIHRVTHMKI